jgi:hypothetical protein
MIASGISFVLESLPAVLLPVAVACAALGFGRECGAERLLSWVLLLPIGVAGIWGALFDSGFLARSAALPGWQASSLEFNGVTADLAIGLTACLAFQRTLGFKAAVVIAASVFLLGKATEHLRQMLTTNFPPGDLGAPLLMDLTCPLLSLVLLVLSWRANQVSLSLRAEMSSRARR